MSNENKIKFFSKATHAEIKIGQKVVHLFGTRKGQVSTFNGADVNDNMQVDFQTGANGIDSWTAFKPEIFGCYAVEIKERN